MNTNSSRRMALIVFGIVVLIVLLLLGRCILQRPVPTPSPAPKPTPSLEGVPTPFTPIPHTPDQSERPESLVPATITAPASVGVGATFEVSWTGPNNTGDFVTIVPAGAPSENYASYASTSDGPTLTITAPIDATGSEQATSGYEVRYVTGKSRTVLARAPIVVLAAAASLIAPAQAVIGSEIQVAWTGPNNQGDYITIVEKDAPDTAYVNYTNTSAGSPLRVRALPDAGEVEIRYVSGQGRRVMGRRAITLTKPTVTLDAPERAIAGSTIEITWTGPDNQGDYLTLCEKSAPDSAYTNYTNTSAGSPLRLLTPMLAGDAEIRYVMGQGRTVLARRTIWLAAAEVTLAAVDECAPGNAVEIAWTGPNFDGDYITIVPKGAANGMYLSYTTTTTGSPVRVNAPKEVGDAEIRYVAGQGGKVLARRTIRVR
ncbi:MAG: hypothetical protein AB7Q00_05230 [Phycisphaerales bacterium]